MIGLFCGFNLSISATDYLIKKLGINKEEIDSLEYRGGKWPGGFLVRMKDGSKKFLEKDCYSFIFPLFIPDRCLYCTDLTSELADISVGDYWLKEGWSMIIVRSKRGEDILKSTNSIDMEEVSYEDMLKSHGHLFRYKKKGSSIRMKIDNTYTSPIAKVGPLSFLFIREAIFYFFIKTVKTGPISRVVKSIPLKVLTTISKLGKRVI